jgi:hypothetical protein
MRANDDYTLADKGFTLVVISTIEDIRELYF